MQKATAGQPHRVNRQRERNRSKTATVTRFVKSYKVTLACKSNLGRLFPVRLDSILVEQLLKKSDAFLLLSEIASGAGVLNPTPARFRYLNYVGLGHARLEAAIDDLLAADLISVDIDGTVRLRSKTAAESNE